MRILVTGSAGHLGEALVRSLRAAGHEVAGIDLLDSPFTTHVGSIGDEALLRECCAGVDWVFHTATLHKPHVATHARSAFVETNIAGTLALLEAAAQQGVSAFVYSSTTSTYGAALRRGEDERAVWVDEALPCVPKNIYGVTKRAAEDLCELFARTRSLPSIVLRLARFFPEEDDDRARRERYHDTNLKVNEYLYRRVDLADVVDANLRAAERAATLGFGRYVITATTPFDEEHLAELRRDARAVVRRLVPEYEDAYRHLGWVMLPSLDRVYVNRLARHELGWTPRYDFRHVLERAAAGSEIRSPLACAVGSKGYHAERFEDGPYPVE